MRNAGTLILLPHTEFTSAIQLIIEIIFLDDLQATFLQTVLAPVMVPPDDTVIWWDRFYPQSTDVDSHEGHTVIDYVTDGCHRCFNVLRTFR